MIVEALQRKLNINPTDEEYTIHRYNSSYDGPDYVSFFDKREKWLKKLMDKNEQVNYYDKKAFEKVLENRWFETCSSNAKFGIWMWNRFWKSNLTSNLNKIEYFLPLLKFYIKCLLRKS